MQAPPRKLNGAEALLFGLKEMGVDYIFGNVGTDFPPILGAYTRFQQEGRVGHEVPVPITVPHENVAINMAYGYYLESGKPQVVFVHTNVGTANALMGMIDANRAQIPLIVIAGKAPTTEQFDRTSKPGFIHWAQEMADQAGMVRENVKWDYHISSDNIHELDLILQRAYAMATAYPPGPVYLTFVPEAIEKEIEVPAFIPSPAEPSKPQPDPANIHQLAQWLSRAERPLLISGGTSRDDAILPALVALAESQQCGVSGLLPRNLHFPTNHALWLGDNPHAAVPSADLIISLESDVPYMPLHARPNSACRVVHVGPDPLFQRYQRRGFRADANITSDVVALLDALRSATSAPSKERRMQRDVWIQQIRRRKLAHRTLEVEKAIETGEMTFGWVSSCISTLAVKHQSITVMREFDLQADYLELEEPGRFYALSNAGGLGWGQGAALGVRLANPHKIPLLATGDGCYYFGVPTSAHSVSATHNLPFITLVFNNGQWATVTNYVNRWYPTLEEPSPPLTSLGPQPAFEKLVEVFHGHGERVEKPAELPAALERAYAAVLAGKQALINVICASPIHKGEVS